VTLRVFGDYAMRVADPVRLVTNMTATVDVTDNERIAGWVSDQLLKVLRTHVTTQIIRNGWPILGLMAYSAEIEQATIDAANGQLVAYGVQLTRMGNFDVNLSPEDEKQLKQLAKDTSYSQLAGGFQNYAAGEMALGAGQGMAKGGGAVDGAFLGAGFGLASAMGAQQVANQQAQAQAAQQAAAQQGMPPYGHGGPGGQQHGGPPQPQGGQPQGGPPPQQASSGPVCASCQAPNPAGAKFCMGCGQALAPAVQHCTECGSELPASAHFCSGCGTRIGA
jgi:ribosomal protein L40E